MGCAFTAQSVWRDKNILIWLKNLMGNGSDTNNKSWMGGIARYEDKRRN